MFTVVSMLRKSTPTFQLHSISSSFMRQKWFQRDIRASSKPMPVKLPRVSLCLIICLMTHIMWQLVVFEW